MSKAYFDMVRPTYIEAWPAGLARLSIAQADVPLTLAEARDLGTNIVEFGEGFVVRTPQEAGADPRSRAGQARPGAGTRRHFHHP